MVKSIMNWHVTASPTAVPLLSLSIPQSYRHQNAWTLASVSQIVTRAIRKPPCAITVSARLEIELSRVSIPNFAEVFATQSQERNLQDHEPLDWSRETPASETSQTQAPCLATRLARITRSIKPMCDFGAFGPSPRFYPRNGSYSRENEVGYTARDIISASCLTTSTVLRTCLIGLGSSPRGI